MGKEEGKEEQVVPEVVAARKELERYAKVFLEDMADPDYEYLESAIEVDAQRLRTWSGIVLSDDVPEAFWQQVLEDVEYWLKRTKEDIAERKILRAIKYAQLALKVLSRYTKLLGLETPPEEEEAPPAKGEFEAPSAPTEEPPAEEGTPLRVLGLSNRVYNALCRSAALLEPLDLIVVDSEGRKTLKREPYAEEVLAVFETRGEKFFLGFKDFGEKALEELKEKLREKRLLPNTEWEAYDEAVY